MYNYWVANKGALDAALATEHDAADAIGNGDTVTASADFSNCASQASDAVTSSFSNVPDGWDDLRDSFAYAAQALKDACNTGVSALDDGKPSEVADFQSKMSDFNSYEAAIVVKAMSLWTTAGGDPNSL